MGEHKFENTRFWTKIHICQSPNVRGSCSVQFATMAPNNLKNLLLVFFQSSQSLQSGNFSLYNLLFKKCVHTLETLPESALCMRKHLAYETRRSMSHSFNLYKSIFPIADTLHNELFNVDDVSFSLKKCIHLKEKKSVQVRKIKYISYMHTPPNN